MDVCSGDKVLHDDSKRIIDLAHSPDKPLRKSHPTSFIVPISIEDQATGTERPGVLGLSIDRYTNLFPRNLHINVSGYTALFHIWWKTARISESYGELTRDTASQLQRFLGPNKGSGIFLRMRQETVQ
jgi:hypothetical protein